MDFDKFDALIARLTHRLDEIDASFLEIDAALTAHTMLLEVAFANAFISDPDGVVALTDQLAERLRTRATTGNVPMDEAVKVELQARAAARLIRFGLQTAAQIRSDRGR